MRRDSGRHKRHCTTVQVLTDPLRNSRWLRPATRGAVHAARAIRTDGAIDALTQSGARALLGRQGLSRCWRHRADSAPQPLALAVRRVANIAHVTISALGEATLRTRRLLRKLHGDGRHDHLRRHRGRAPAGAHQTVVLCTDESGASIARQAAFASPQRHSATITHAFTGRPSRAPRNYFTALVRQRGIAGLPGEHLRAPLRVRGEIPLAGRKLPP